MAAIDCVTNAQSIAVYFESIPEHILIQLDPNRRKDMVDLFMAGKPAVTRTKFGGPAELVSLNEKYLKIEIAENSIIEMALLGDTAQYIGVIKTICAPACDSEIEFYTTTWSPITSISVDKPGLKDFLYNIDGYGNGPLKPTWDGGNNIKNKNKIVEKSISGDSQDNQASEDLDSDIEMVSDEKLELQEIKDNIKGYPFYVHYAIKANANPKILEIIKESGFGIDCVSGGELKASLDAGIESNKIVFAGVAKTDKEIIAGLEANIECFNVESINELENINELAKERNLIANIAIRINPNIDANTHKYITTGLNENKFGINLEQLDSTITSALNMENINLCGIHFHIGSQLTDLDPFVK